MQYSLCSVIYIVKKSMSRLFSVSLIDSSILLRIDVMHLLPKLCSESDFLKRITEVSTSNHSFIRRWLNGLLQNHETSITFGHFGLKPGEALCSHKDLHVILRDRFSNFMLGE